MGWNSRIEEVHEEPEGCRIVVPIRVLFTLPIWPQQELADPVQLRCRVVKRLLPWEKQADTAVGTWYPVVEEPAFFSSVSEERIRSYLHSCGTDSNSHLQFRPQASVNSSLDIIWSTAIWMFHRTPHKPVTSVTSCRLCKTSKKWLTGFGKIYTFADKLYDDSSACHSVKTWGPTSGACCVFLLSTSLRPYLPMEGVAEIGALQSFLSAQHCLEWVTARRSVISLKPG